MAKAKHEQLNLPRVKRGQKLGSMGLPATGQRLHLHKQVFPQNIGLGPDTGGRGTSFQGGFGLDISHHHTENRTIKRKQCQWLAAPAHTGQKNSSADRAEFPKSFTILSDANYLILHGVWHDSSDDLATDQYRHHANVKP